MDAPTPSMDLVIDSLRYRTSVPGGASRKIFRTESTSTGYDNVDTTQQFQQLFIMNDRERSLTNQK